MGNVTIITNAIGRFANAMRLYGEAFIRYRGLAAIDREEAIHNLDRAFEQILRVFIRYMMYRKGCLTFMLIRIPVS
ncbi:hypothetical protein RHT76_07275 [Escherichia coli]|uniref:hypothetical protein n=1 Tax=Escherichia coli TaxID=562 RepID=UPI0017C1387A|nr:hypothetical protein [Escherichia coli]WMZ34617.1 hypothetical protein RHT76_07275 [Escherichia coli]HAH2204389.1 hypothetical protein [Escherichia coli]HAH5058846.1 hypothetical protein [Escherichia coli]